MPDPFPFSRYTKWDDFSTAPKTGSNTGSASTQPVTNRPSGGSNLSNLLDEEVAQIDQKINFLKSLPNDQDGLRAVRKTGIAGTRDQQLRILGLNKDRLLAKAAGGQNESFLGDVGSAVSSGAANFDKAIGYATGNTGLQQQARRRQEISGAEMTDYGREAREKGPLGEDMTFGQRAYATALALAESTPEVAATAVIAAGVSAAAPAAGAAAIGAKIISSAPRLARFLTVGSGAAASTSANVVGQRAIAAVANMGLSGTQAGLVTGSDTTAQVLQQIDKDPEAFMNSRLGKELLNENGGDFEAAKNAAANSVGRNAAMAVGAVEALMTLPAAVFEARLLTGGTRRGIAKEAASGLVSEGISEAPASANEQLVQNLSMQTVGSDVGTLDGVAKAAGEGFIVGGALGGGLGAGGSVVNRLTGNATDDQTQPAEDEELATALAARGEATPPREGGNLIEDQNAVALRGLGNISAGGLNYTPDQILDIARNNESNPRIADIMSQPVSDVTKVEQVARILNQEEVARLEPEAVRRISGMFGGTNSVSNSKQMIADELSKINPAIIAESPTLSAIAQSLESTGKQFVSGLRNAVSNYQPTAPTGTLFARPERGGEGSVILSQEDVTNEAQREREAQQAFRLADVRQRRFDTATGELTQREDLRAGAPEPEAQFFLNPAVYGEDLGGIAATIVGAEGGKVRIQYDSPTELDGNGTPAIISEDVDPTAMFDRVVRGTARMTQELAGDVRKPRKGTGTDLNPRQSVDRTSTRAIVPTESGLPATISPTRMTGFEANTDQMPVEQQAQNAQVNPQQERPVNLEGNVEGPNEISGAPAQLPAPAQKTLPAPAQETAPAPEAKAEAEVEAPTQDVGRKVEKHVENIEDKILDLDRSGIVRYADKVHKEGLIDDADLAEIKRMSKDKDMGAEDIGPELISQLNTKQDDGGARYSGRRDVVRPKAKKASDVVQDTPLSKDAKAAPEAEAKPEIDYEAVIQDRLDKLAARGGQGKIVSSRLRSLLKQNNYNPTQLYYAFQMGEVVSRVLPTNSKVDVLFVPSLTATDASAAAASGIDLGAEASGAYRAYTLSQNGFRGLITLSLNENLANVARENAAHEAFHVIQDFLQVDFPQLYDTINSSFYDGMRIKDLDASILRKLKTLKTDREGSVYDSLVEDFGDTPLGGFEAQAVAFGALVDAKDRGVDMKGLKASFIRYIDFLSDMLRGFRNLFRKDGVESVAEIFEGFRTGETSKGFTEPAPLAEQDRGEQYSGRKKDSTTGEFKKNIKASKLSADELFAQPDVKQGAMGVTEAAIEIQKRTLSILGRPITAAGQKDDLLAQTVAHEVKSELARSGKRNASGWYTEEMRKATAVASMIHPEIATDVGAQLHFTAALAITSQNQSVDANAVFAERWYEHYKKNGKFPENEGWGKAASSIMSNAQLFNSIVEKYGAEAVSKFFATKFTVRELRAAGFSNVSGASEEMVYGSAVLGPKIGFGFYSNLNGRYDPVTIDMWFMRTWGRMTGDLIGADPELIQQQEERLTKALADDGRPTNAYGPELLEVAQAESKAFEKDFKVNRAAYDSGEKVKPETALAAQRLLASFEDTKDAPKADWQRTWIRDIVAKSQQILQGDGINITNADLQAVLWYPEKRLWSKKFGVREKGKGADDAGSAGETSYYDEFVRIAKKRGFTDGQISTAVQPKGGRGQGSGSVLGGKAVNQNANGQSGAANEFAPRDARRFIQDSVVTRLNKEFSILDGAGSATSGRPSEHVSRKAGGNLARSVEGRTPVAATYSHSVKVKNALAVAGIDAPKFLELTTGSASAKLYHRLISEAQKANKAGAAVYVYDQKDYADMRLFLTEDGLTGFALKGDDLVSVFKHPSSEARGVAIPLARMAVWLGARRLDAFDTVLPYLYSSAGFKVAARTKWNDEFAPDNWDKAEFDAFNNGEPDVVFMYHDPARSDFYTKGEGEYFDQYDDAVAAQSGKAGNVQYSGRRGRGGGQTGPQALRPAYSFRSDNYNFGGEAPDKLDEVIYNLQDKLIDVKRIQKNIKDAGGRISETTDVYRAEELFHGRAAKRAKDFVQRELNPLLEEMKTKGVPLETLDKFLHARHAKERNAQIRKINPDMQDNGSGMSDAAADSYFAGLPNARRKQLEKLADRVDAITKSTQDMMVKYGLETQETIDNWNKTYKSYVPLQREGFEDGGAGSSGQGMSVRGSSSRRALGSELGVVDILANIAMQRERVISRGERNRVGNALTALALQNPNDSFWFVIDPKSADAAKAKQKLIDFGMDPADAENVMGAPMTSYMDTNSGRLVKRPNSLFMSSPFVMATRINGEDKFIAFNSRNPRSQRMVTALKNIDAFQMGAFVSGIAKVTRYFASINTQYNPAFGLYNLMRDLGGASINLSSTPIAGKQRQVIGNALPAALGMYRDLRSERSGKTATTNWAELADEFELEGGKTGFRDLFTTSQDRADAIEIELTGGSKLRQVATKVGGPVFDWLSDFNEAIENGVRLSAYKTAKEAGLSKAEAASIAKNLTVNFNRKGVVGAQAGAFYAFFNASVQGTARLAETLKGPAGKKIIAGGLLLGVAQAVALAAAGIDDEIPDWLKDKNLVIPLGGKKYFAIPMPLGLHVIPSLGRRSVEFFMSGGEKAPEQIIGLLGMMADSFNPIGNAGLSLQTVTPTVLDPLAALAENKDFAGRDIARKDFNSLDPTAGYERNKEGVSAVGDYVARAIDYVTGGNGYTAGTLSPTGDQVDYLIGQATGGVGRLALNTMATAQAAVTGEDLPNYKIPVVGRMIGDANEASAISGRFYDGIKEMNAHKKTVEGMEEDGKDTTSYFEDYPEAEFFDAAQEYESDISKLRKEKKQLKEDGAPQQEIDYVTEEMQMLMVEFNQQIADYKKR